MADFDAQLPVRTVASEFTTEVANSSGTTINPAEDYAQGSTTSGQNGVLTQGAVTTASPTYSTGTTNPLSLDTSGNLRVTLSASSAEQNVNLNQVGGAAISLGQKVSASSLPVVIASDQSAIPVTLTSTTITGTVAVTQSTSPWVISGTVTANIGTTNGLALDATVAKLTLAQGSTTSGETGPLIQGAVTTAAPTYSTSTTNPLSLTTAGALRVDGSATTQPVSGTVTANQGTANATPWNQNISQFGGTSTSLGQKVMASSMPVVIASDQSPINVQFGGVTPVVTYATTASVASGSSATQTVSGPINLDAVHVTASGETKVVIAIGVAGSEVTKWVGFTSASNKNFDWILQDTYAIPSGSDVKITITNKDTAAMDLYSSVVNH